jgi:NDP-sugar pyrophosphorylase family protein
MDRNEFQLREYSSPNISFSVEDEKPLGTAGGVVLGLRSGEIPRNRPIVLCNGDAFSNIDLSKTVHKFTNTNAGLMIFGYPVEKERLKSFGILGFEPKEGNNEITKFIEKPDPDKSAELKEAEAGQIKDPSDPNNGKFYASIAIYVMSPEITNILAQIAPENESYDFGFNFLPLMQKILNTKEPIKIGDIPIENKEDIKEQKRIYDKLKELNIIDDKGIPQDIYPVKPSFDNNFNMTPVPDKSKKPLKMLVAPAEGIKNIKGYWNDIGSTEAYIKEMREIASNPDIYKGMHQDFIKGVKENVKDGIVFIPEMVNPKLEKGKNSRILRDVKFENFKKAYGITKITGEIIVTEKLPAEKGK